MTEKLEELGYIARGCAERVAAQYPGIEADDVKQELAIYILENADSIRLFEEGGNPVLVFNREARRICNKEFRRSSAVLSNMEYTSSDVRRALNDCLLMQGMVNTFVPENSKSYRPKKSRRANEAPMADWDSVIIACDIREHIRYLPESDKVTLFRRYVLDDPEMAAPKYQMRVNAAIDRLVTELNRFGSGNSAWEQAHPNGWVGSRGVMSGEAGDTLSSPENVHGAWDD